MTITRSLYFQYQRYRTLQTGYVSTLPIVILMPHSACNCRCVICDIWKDNGNLKQLDESDISGLMESLKRLGTRQVLMSGGEALLNPLFFDFCKKMNSAGIRVSLLSTGLTLKKHADKIVSHVADVIVSLDGDEALHDHIRNIPGAFRKLEEGVRALRDLDPGYRVTARTVIHRLNFRHWPRIIEAARKIGVQQLSFLPADVSSHAFNREMLWSEQKQHEIMPALEELPELDRITGQVIEDIQRLGLGNFIAESPDKLRKIPVYYSALWGLNPFPYKKCNAPWVSAVIEADGNVRPCFFHAPIGNIRQQTLRQILNGEKGLRFRRELDMDKNDTCKKCVCYLNLSPRTKLDP